VELRDDTIVLRPWRMDDAPAVFVACQDPALSHWIPWIPSPYSPEDAETFLQGCLDSGDERLPLAIEDAERGELLGSIEMRLDTQRVRGHIGYWVAAPARGRGICTRALRLLAIWGHESLELRRLELITDPANVASQRVAEKVGFVREGVLRSHLRHPDGRVRDSVMFSLLPGEVR
jgi:RimJ/RimL family protein N-acetyltransferase